MNKGVYKLLIAGTKNGWIKFYSSPGMNLSGVDLSDLRDLVNINVSNYNNNKGFYSIEYVNNNVLISIYRAIVDWHDRGGGYYAITFVLDSTSGYTYKGIATFLKQLSDLYWEKYIVKNGDRKFQITKSIEDFESFEKLKEQYLHEPKNYNDIGLRIVTDGGREYDLQAEFQNAAVDLEQALKKLLTNRNNINRIFLFEAGDNDFECSYRKVSINDVLNTNNREIYKQDYAPPRPPVRTPAPKPGEVKRTPLPRGEQEKRKPSPHQQKPKVKAPSQRIRPDRKRVVLHLFIVLVGIILIGAMIGYYLNEGSSFSKEELQQELKVVDEDLTTDASDGRLQQAKNSIDSICSLFREDYSRNTDEINSICTGHLNKVENLLEKKQQVEQLDENIKEQVTSTSFDVEETKELLNLARKSGTRNQIKQLEEYLEIAKTVKAAKKYIYMNITGSDNIKLFKNKHYEPAKATKNKLKGYYSSNNTASKPNLSKYQIKDIELFHDLLRNELNAVLDKSTLFEYISSVLLKKDASYRNSRYKELARFYNAHKPDNIEKIQIIIKDE